jgi:hypothetical protein
MNLSKNYFTDKTRGGTISLNETGTKEITTLQYAKYLGCTSQNISKHIRNGRLEFLPDVIRIKNYSRFKLLVVRIDLPVS